MEEGAAAASAIFNGAEISQGADAGLAGAGAVVVLGVLLNTLGVKVCGSVARCAAAGSVGKYSGPFCPQPDKTTMLPARAAVFTRI
jgi:hypothetical protein